MERLTEWNKQHTSASVKYHSNYVNKLAEYEDLEENFINHTGMNIKEYFENIFKVEK